MELYNEVMDKAVKNIKIADHMLTQTYPLVKDPKILLAVLENTFLSLTNAMGALLHYEVMNKEISPFQENFESKFNILKLKLMDKYKIDKGYVRFISDIRDMVVSHKKSPVEFARKDAFVICSDDYKLRTLTQDDMKAYVSRAKSFLQEVNSIIRKNEENVTLSRGR